MERFRVNVNCLPYDTGSWQEPDDLCVGFTWWGFSEGTICRHVGTAKGIHRGWGSSKHHQQQKTLDTPVWKWPRGRVDVSTPTVGPMDIGSSDWSLWPERGAQFYQTHSQAGRGSGEDTNPHLPPSSCPLIHSHWCPLAKTQLGSREQGSPKNTVHRERSTSWGTG